MGFGHIDGPVKYARHKKGVSEDTPFYLAPRAGLEPATNRLTVYCSTN